MESIIHSSLFVILGLVIFFVGIASFFIFTSTDIIGYTLFTIPYVASYVIVRSIINKMRVILDFTGNYTAENITIFYVTNYFCTFFMMFIGILLIVQVINIIYF